jgi:hypothetical protein
MDLITERIYRRGDGWNYNGRADHEVVGNKIQGMGTRQDRTIRVKCGSLIRKGTRPTTKELPNKGNNLVNL